MIIKPARRPPLTRDRLYRSIPDSESAGKHCREGRHPILAIIVVASPMIPAILVTRPASLLSHFRRTRGGRTTPERREVTDAKPSFFASTGDGRRRLWCAMFGQDRLFGGASNKRFRFVWGRNPDVKGRRGLEREKWMFGRPSATSQFDRQNGSGLSALVSWVLIVVDGMLRRGWGAMAGRRRPGGER